MEIGGAGGESAQDRSFDLANMVEFAIDQGLGRDLLWFCSCRLPDLWRGPSCTP
jgi:hypothetical protein